MVDFFLLKANQFAQGLLPIEEMLEFYHQIPPANRRERFDTLYNLIIQSKPKEEDIKEAIENSRLKPTYTPCVVLKTYGLKLGIPKVLNLPENESVKAYQLLLYLFQIAYLRRYREEKNLPGKWWYLDLSSPRHLELARKELKLIKQDERSSLTTIRLQTLIHAPIEICFDLARSVDTHLLSTEQTSERAVAGRTSGLLEKGEEVTWEAIHFGIRQRLTVRMTEMDPPYFFCDQMVKGAFKSMLHRHSFQQRNDSTLMIDEFSYKTPFGIFGRLFDRWLLKSYMTRFLVSRNQVLKQIAEAQS